MILFLVPDVPQLSPEKIRYEKGPGNNGEYTARTAILNTRTMSVNGSSAPQAQALPNGKNQSRAEEVRNVSALTLNQCNWNVFTYCTLLYSLIVHVSLSFVHMVIGLTFQCRFPDLILKATFLLTANSPYLAPQCGAGPSDPIHRFCR